jgi:hypothetical protein
MSEIGAQSGLTPLFVSTLGLNSAVTVAAKLTPPAGPGPLTWVANQAVFMPVVLPWPYQVRRVFWQNGSTITTSNADFGIYTEDGTRLYSTGSTALSGTNTPQFVSPTAFLLSPGAYYFAYVCDNTTNRSFGFSIFTTTAQRQAGILQQASALPLPASMSSAGAATQAVYEICGITRTASGY